MLPPGSHQDFSKSNALDGCPDDGEATHLGGEHIDLIGALANITEQAFDGVGSPNIAVHRLRKLVKGERVLLLCWLLRISVLKTGQEAKQ